MRSRLSCACLMDPIHSNRPTFKPANTSTDSASRTSAPHMCPYVPRRDKHGTVRRGAAGAAPHNRVTGIAEIGADMSIFPTAGHLASWAQMCPGNNITGGKRNSGTKRRRQPVLVGGLGEEGRLNVSGGRAVATGHALPRRLGASMQQRLDLLSNGAGEVVRVAAVLPDRFSAGLLAAMLERQPASLMSALDEAVRADLLVEDDEQLRFRHELREAVVTLVVSMGRDGAALRRHCHHPMEVATQ
jgi:Transposase IS116/IS110/IS902 family